MLPQVISIQQKQTNQVCNCCCIIRESCYITWSLLAAKQMEWEEYWCGEIKWVLDSTCEVQVLKIHG